MISPLLDHDVQHLAFLVDCAPQVNALATDGADDLVQMPASVVSLTAAGEAQPLPNPP